MTMTMTVINRARARAQHGVVDSMETKGGLMWCGVLLVLVLLSAGRS